LRVSPPLVRVIYAASYTAAARSSITNSLRRAVVVSPVFPPAFLAADGAVGATRAMREPYLQAALSPIVVGPDSLQQHPHGILALRDQTTSGLAAFHQGSVVLTVRHGIDRT
jgi:hypothetical protein